MSEDRGRRARYHVYATPGTLREQVFLGGFDTFSEARDVALDCVYDKGLPVHIDDTTKADATFGYAPIALGVPVQRRTSGD